MLLKLRWGSLYGEELHFGCEVLLFFLFLMTVPMRCHWMDSAEPVILQKALKTSIVKKDCKEQNRMRRDM